MFAIEFGGMVFFILACIFLFLQAIFLFNEKNGLSLGLFCGYVAAMFFLVDDWPDFNYKFLVIYPILAMLWLPVYWYLDLLRRATRIKSLVAQHGSLEKAYRALGASDPLRNDFRVGIDKYGEGEEGIKANLRHPHANDLFANCLLFPLSIPLFFGENFVRMSIDYLTHWMENVKKKFNDSINSFKV